MAVSKPLRWHQSPVQPNLQLRQEPGYLLSWLLRSCSLTRCLTTLYGGRFRVELRSQHWRRAETHEARQLKVGAGQRLLVREVVLWGAETPLVFARSLLPASTLTGPQQQLARLGNNPLGGLLFNSRKVRRGATQTAQITRDSELHQCAAKITPLGERPLWARRTPFEFRSGRILVMECFLPGILMLQPPNEY